MAVSAEHPCSSLIGWTNDSMPVARRCIGARIVRRARAHLEEYADIAVRSLRLTTKGTVKRGTLRPVLAGPQQRPMASELGVTDAVLATIWQFGPQGITHEVAPLAERYYTGSDIAFIDGGTRRILLYQAKVSSTFGPDVSTEVRCPGSPADAAYLKAPSADRGTPVLTHRTRRHVPEGLWRQLVRPFSKLSGLAVRGASRSRRMADGWLGSTPSGAGVLRVGDVRRGRLTMRRDGWKLAARL